MSFLLVVSYPDEDSMDGHWVDNEFSKRTRSKEVVVVVRVKIPEISFRGRFLTNLKIKKQEDS